MFNKYFLISVVLSVSGLLMTVNAADAQGNRGGRVVSQPVYRPAYQYPQYHYSYPTNAYRSVWIAPTYYAPSYYAPYYAPSYYAPSYVVPTYSYYPPSTASVTSAVADIRVIVPDPRATVFFDGQPTTSTGTDRLFHTPSLAYGGTYTYRLQAMWMDAGRPVSQERIVIVTPGQTTVVNFTQPPVEGIRRPSGGG